MNRVTIVTIGSVTDEPVLLDECAAPDCTNTPVGYKAYCNGDLCDDCNSPWFSWCLEVIDAGRIDEIDLEVWFRERTED